MSKLTKTHVTIKENQIERIIKFLDKSKTMVDYIRNTHDVRLSDVRKLEEGMDELADMFELDQEDKNFTVKKEATSAFRRLAPMGVATNIGWSANMRTIRHVIEMRTHPGAEEEIRLVFAKVAEIAISKWGNIFADYNKEIVDGLPWYTTTNRKV